MRSRCDIAIVGYGPVGQTLAILLGRLGYAVEVFERWPGLYARPRAVHYDDEVARIFQRLGIAGQLAAITEPASTYEWQNASGETLLLLDRSSPGPSGWPAATMFSQPELERLLDATAKAVPSVDVHQGWQATELSEEAEQVRITVRRTDIEEAAPHEHEVTAAYAIGCDGANSIVRERMGTPVQDLGFAYDWLIADTIPRDPRLLAGVNLQRCDPRRPTTLVSGGPGRRRWEWMLLAGETREQVENEDFVWRMLGQSGLGPDQLELERLAVYTFRARWAERWREGRLLLAGDAAHQMPPFAGQGLCSGMRDAVSLAWHLDLVMRGVAKESTLDAYTSERRGHLQHAISVSVELGKVICIADESEAAARDELLLGLAADPTAPPIEPPAPDLGPGLHDGRAANGGTLFPQGRLTVEGRRELAEDVHGGGFALYALERDPAELLDEEARGVLERLACALVDLRTGEDPIYPSWFEAHRCAAALVRPDFYVFGTATTPAQTRALVRRLQALLAGRHRTEGSLTTWARSDPPSTTST